MKKPDLKSEAVMNVDKGESIEEMWATPQIPRIGVYKLAAKKRVDGVYEWVHFQHRPDGTRNVLFRGEVESKERLTVVLDAASRQLHKIFGVTMSAAEASMKTLDGRSTDSKVH
jgi:hypothetical protein